MEACSICTTPKAGRGSSQPASAPVHSSNTDHEHITLTLIIWESVVLAGYMPGMVRDLQMLNFKVHGACCLLPELHVHTRQDHDFISHQWDCKQWQDGGIHGYISTSVKPTWPQGPHRTRGREKIHPLPPWLLQASGGRWSHCWSRAVDPTVKHPTLSIHCIDRIACWSPGWPSRVVLLGN